MQNNFQWFNYFTKNLQQQRINWETKPTITQQQISAIIPSLKAWQLGETSEGKQLTHAASLQSKKLNDPYYLQAIVLFIKEEQKHGENLGKYLDAIHVPRLKRNWGDTMFRKIRHINTGMESFTLTVLTLESAAQVYYQCIKDATNCSLLKQICTDILVDEAAHIKFQTQRMQQLYNLKSSLGKWFCNYWYAFFYSCTSAVVYATHRKAFNAGNVNAVKFAYKMYCKYNKTFGKLFTKTFTSSLQLKTNQHALTS